VSGLGSNDVLKSRTSEQAPTPKTSMDLPTQCASYALEMMSHGGIRHHAIGASIIDENITLQYYSHSIILYSKPFNFVADFPRFLSVLLQLMSLGRKEWGFANLMPNLAFKIPEVNADRRRPFLSLYRGQSLAVGGQSFVLEDFLNQQHGIIGRGTCVIGAKSDQGVEAVVKFSWRESGRTPENEFIERARVLALTGKDENGIANHLPHILGRYTDDHWMKLGSQCEPRHLQVMVFTKLIPITQLTDVKELAEAIRGIFKCSCSPVVSLEGN
jgi:hypothetical protein